jgi:pimeloyl-ACP methyl ester carboxylesterase
MYAELSYADTAGYPQAIWTSTPSNINAIPKALRQDFTTESYEQPEFTEHIFSSTINMLQLHEDLNFHYETMRALGTVSYHGADLSEVFEIMPKIKAGDFDSWYDEWNALAHRVLATIDEKKESSYSPATLRDVYFRVSHYIFVADFFLHGNKSDPRLPLCYNLWRKYFDKANALLPIPGKHATIKADGFEMPAIIFRAAQASAESPRPTLIIGGGFESNMEETFHVYGFAALERGYNVLIYEGPGHRTLVQTQGKGFIAEWEKAVTPIVDHIFANKSELSFIDTNKIGLIGMSLGGYLAARAAAFEPRLAAVMCMDGVYSFHVAAHKIFPQGKAAFEAGNKAEYDRLFEENPETWSTNRRWFHDDMKFTFCKDSGYECMKVAEAMTLANGVAERIKMPAFMGDALDDMFFEGQPAQAAKAIGKNATLVRFGPEGLGSQLHCQSGALIYMNDVMFEWFAGVVGH